MNLASALTADTGRGHGKDRKEEKRCEYVDALIPAFEAGQRPDSQESTRGSDNTDLYCFLSLSSANAFFLWSAITSLVLVSPSERSP